MNQNSLKHKPDFVSGGQALISSCWDADWDLRARLHPLAWLAAVLVSLLCICGLWPTEVRGADKPEKRVETELVTLFSYGFEPTEIKRPAGEFFLAVDNRSGLKQVSISLVDDKAKPVCDFLLRKEKFKARDRLNLKPGLYVLTEASHPSWKCKLTITAEPN
jgi:hypothetical protein